MTIKEFIKLYKQYQQTTWYNTSNDLGAFIAWLAEMELTK